MSSVLQVYRIPLSCCRDGVEEISCKLAVETGIGAQIANEIYSEVSICVVHYTRLNPFRMVAGMYVDVCQQRSRNFSFVPNSMYSISAIFSVVHLYVYFLGY